MADWTQLLGAIGGLAGIGAFVTAIYAARGVFRKQAADAKQVEVRAEVELDEASLRALATKQKLDERHGDWYIAKLQKLVEDLTKKTDAHADGEKRCLMRLARAETLLAEFCKRLEVPFPKLDGEA